MDVEDVYSAAIGAVGMAVAFVTGVLDGLVTFLLSFGDLSFLLSGNWYPLVAPAVKYVGPAVAPDALPWELVTTVVVVAALAVALYKFSQ